VPYPSFATDNAGFPEIAYFLSTSSSSVLRLAKYVEYSWQKETVASFGSPVYCAHVVGWDGILRNTCGVLPIARKLQSESSLADRLEVDMRGYRFCTSDGTKTYDSL
jgi:hypothetical protein